VSASERERARDRSGRHDEDVRALASGKLARREHGALRHAEAVLLVDDDEAQALERHGALEQGVRADDEVRLAGR